MVESARKNTPIEPPARKIVLGKQTGWRYRSSHASRSHKRAKLPARRSASRRTLKDAKNVKRPEERRDPAVACPVEKLVSLNYSKLISHHILNTIEHAITDRWDPS